MALLPDWYVAQRRELREDFANGFSTHGSTHEAASYRLEVEGVSTKYGGSRGTVFGRTNEPIAVIERNYPAFPFAFVLGHPSGHDYLVCGEDYQGLTVIELDSGRRADWIPEDARDGTGWCHTAFYPSPNPTVLAAWGCIWACPYDLKIYDITHPMNLPWRTIDTFEELGDEPGWGPQGMRIKCYEEVRKADGKRIVELSREEQLAHWADRSKTPWQYRKRTYQVGTDGSRRLEVDSLGYDPELKQAS